jgi:hypothetical protein
VGLKEEMNPAVMLVQGDALAPWFLLGRMGWTRPEFFFCFSGVLPACKAGRCI